MAFRGDNFRGHEMRRAQILSSKYHSPQKGNRFLEEIADSRCGTVKRQNDWKVTKERKKDKVTGVSVPERKEMSKE